MQEKTNKKTFQSLASTDDTWLYLQHLDSVYILDPSFEQDNFELTTRLAASQNNVINETTAGGSLASGVGLETAVYNIVSTGGVSISSIVSIDSYNFLRDIKYSFEIGQKVYYISNNLSPQKTIISRIILENNVFRYVTPVGDFYSNEISSIEEKDKILNLNIENNISDKINNLNKHKKPPSPKGGKFVLNSNNSNDLITNNREKIMKKIKQLSGG